jgi:RNA polymerase sigma-70 factor, ECF subfamily
MTPDPRDSRAVLDEARLVERLRDSDAAAYRQLVQAHAARLLQVATRLLGESRDAEDVVQDAFVAAWQAIGDFDGRSTLEAWLRRKTVDKALARLRARRNEVAIARRADVAASAQVSPPALPPDRALQLAELHQRAWSAIGALEEDDRVVLILRDVEHLASKDVAARLGLSDAAVRQRLHRARQAVATRLRSELGEATSITCGGDLDLLFDHLDGELAGAVAAAVADHLATCGLCQGLKYSYQAVFAAVGAAEAAVSASRVAALIDGAIHAASAGPARSPD